MNKLLALVLLFTSFFVPFSASSTAFAQEDDGEVINLESTIIGSQEQPKVLYIIPWKQANSLEKIESTLPDAINHTFQHQEYSELQREIKLLQPAETD